MFINKKQNKTDDRGFTLIEVMIGLTIFAIGILGVAKMHFSAIQGDQSAREFTEATNIALDQLENLMVGPYAQIAGTTTQTTSDGYRVSWTVTEQTTWEVKTVNMSIQWDDMNQTRTLRFNHMIPFIP